MLELLAYCSELAYALPRFFSCGDDLLLRGRLHLSYLGYARADRFALSDLALNYSRTSHLLALQDMLPRGDQIIKTLLLNVLYN